MVKVNHVEIVLNRKEYDVLLYLMKNEGIVLNRERIIDSVWGYDYIGDGRVVDTNIKTIRKKLGDASRYIHTVVGVGYRFEVTS